MADRSWRVTGALVFVAAWSLLFAAVSPLLRRAILAGRRPR
ncbi:hypothetical protein ACFXG4_27395 [Nocardia sp. NPDC059246]